MNSWRPWIFNGHEFEQAPGDGEGQGSPASCSSLDHIEPDTTAWLNNNHYSRVGFIPSMQVSSYIWKSINIIQHINGLKEKVKVKVSQWCPTLFDPMDCIVPGIVQARILEWVAFPFSRGSSQPGIKPRYPALQVDSLPAGLQGKPKNTGVGSLPLLQWIFLTQESSQGLLHCRQILYQLSYEGSPKSKSLCHVQLFATPQTI